MQNLKVLSKAGIAKVSKSNLLAYNSIIPILPQQKILSFEYCQCMISLNKVYLLLIRVRRIEEKALE
jgi:hypothetical protein